MAHANKARTCLFIAKAGRPVVCAITWMTTGLLCSCIWAQPGSADRLNGTKVLADHQSVASTQREQTAQLEERSEGTTAEAEESDALKYGDGLDIDEEEIVHSNTKIQWLDSRGNECYQSKQNKGFCQGPRRVPKPHGAEAELAVELGLGKIETVWRLLSDSPETSWIQAARGNASEGEKQVKLMWPVWHGVLIRGFGKVGEGKRRHLHKGIDIGAEEGTIFLAVADGIVVYSDNEVRGYGNVLIVVHGDGSVTFYSHARALYVFAGQRVRRGQPIGEVGHTGFAVCDHLHFEYRIRGVPRDPWSKFETTGREQLHIE